MALCNYAFLYIYTTHYHALYLLVVPTLPSKTDQFSEGRGPVTRPRYWRGITIPDVEATRPSDRARAGCVPAREPSSRQADDLSYSTG